MDPVPVPQASPKTLARILQEIVTHDKNYNYRESLIYYALYQARMLGYESGLRIVEDLWPVVFIELPFYGEVSWHMRGRYKLYTGYSSEEKFKRIQDYYDLNHK